MNESKLPMSYNKVLEFLESTQGKSRSEITQLARISCDLGSLDDILTDIYKHVSSHTLRSRLRRIKKCFCPSDSKTEDKHSDAESLAEGMTTEDQLDDEDFNPTASRDGRTAQEYQDAVLEREEFLEKKERAYASPPRRRHCLR
ncbi:hypothetical protein QAD02_006038 [Eretmocerus hayati]|uniref:Uncharacterized protein n=1 Tax=Eretmocerus hayati TaxID=131215 RepID=A0ACC2N0Y0_9HYME|nr:hypothetical protein QAD02_006038 [Eretmocerus hayati]